MPSQVFKILNFKIKKDPEEEKVNQPQMLKNKTYNQNIKEEVFICPRKKHFSNLSCHLADKKQQLARLKIYNEESKL